MSNETVTIPSVMWKNALVQIDELKAENKRLRESGDKLIANYYSIMLDVKNFEKMPSVSEWKNANK